MEHTEGVGVRPHFLVGRDDHTLFGTDSVVPWSESHSGSYHVQNEMETSLCGPACSGPSFISLFITYHSHHSLLQASSADLRTPGWIIGRPFAFVLLFAQCSCPSELVLVCFLTSSSLWEPFHSHPIWKASVSVHSISLPYISSLHSSWLITHTRTHAHTLFWFSSDSQHDAGCLRVGTVSYPLLHLWFLEQYLMHNRHSENTK